MISRRQLIGGGVAVSALGLASRQACAVELRASDAPRITHFLVDARFEDARVIARMAATPGQEITALPRDLLEIWHDQLKPTLDIATESLAGVTTERGFFALRTLAADHRLRVKFSATHVPHDGRIAHEFVGPTALLARCQRQAREIPWQSIVGSALRSCGSGRPTRMRFESSVASARRDEALVSWVIGPAAIHA